MVKKFHIYHCDEFVYKYNPNNTYTKVFELATDDINNVFKLCQNDFNEEYRKLKIRSLSVNDIIVDTTTKTIYLINGHDLQIIYNIKLNIKQKIQVLIDELNCKTIIDLKKDYDNLLIELFNNHNLIVGIIELQNKKYKYTIIKKKMFNSEELVKNIILYENQDEAVKEMLKNILTIL